MDVGIVIPVFLPDDGPDFCGEGVGADAGVFTGAVGNEVLNDGADVPVFGDALAAADGDPEAEEDVVDPVAALGGKLVDISVKPGQKIRQGDTIAWIEREA